MKRILIVLSAVIVASTFYCCTQEDNLDYSYEEYPTQSRNIKTTSPEPGGGYIPHMAIDGGSKLAQLHNSEYSCFTFNVRLTWNSTTTDGCSDEDITECSLLGYNSSNNDFAASNIFCHAAWNSSGTGIDVSVEYTPRQRIYDILSHDYLWIDRDSVHFTQDVSIGEYIHDF